VTIRQRLFAASYDLLNSGVERRLSTYRARTAGRARGEVLEIGGGTGANLPFYTPEARLTFVEPNPHMVRRLRRKAAGLGRDIRVVSDVGERLSFPDGSFDSVVTSLVLCMVEDVERVVAEARRVLRPGGAFYFYEHVVSTRPAGRVWQARLNPVWRFVTTGCNLDRDIAGTIENAGFERVDFERFDLSVGLPVTIPNILGVARP
jgi:ubiquinone/menaquinone biosynthesis C-methylase UbiE